MVGPCPQLPDPRRQILQCNWTVSSALYGFESHLSISAKSPSMMAICGHTIKGTLEGAHWGAPPAHSKRAFTPYTAYVQGLCVGRLGQRIRLAGADGSTRRKRPQPPSQRGAGRGSGRGMRPKAPVRMISAGCSWPSPRSCGIAVLGPVGQHAGGNGRCPTGRPQCGRPWGMGGPLRVAWRRRPRPHPRRWRPPSCSAAQSP
jgi:hypothetical protein